MKLSNMDHQSKLEDLITSEVNASTEPENGTFLATTKFRYSIPKSGDNDKPSKTVSEPKFDEDGDLIIETDEIEDFIQIKHKVQSTLNEVGFQIWRGALFMADFALLHPGLFQDQTVLEIGAGTGLTSIIISKHCQPKKVIATDIELVVTEILEENVKINQSQVIIDTLDVNQFDEKFGQSVVVIGADIVYDNDLTDGIFCFVEKFMSKSGKDITKSFYFTIDKRYLFTIDALDTIAPAYEYFVAKLEEFRENDFQVEIEELIPKDIHQAFCYERSKDLVLISIQITKRT